MGKSLRTNDFRYTEWRDKNDRIIDQELYDHRHDDISGYLEKENIAGQNEFAAAVDRMSGQLMEILE